MSCDTDSSVFWLYVIIATTKKEDTIAQAFMFTYTTVIRQEPSAVAVAVTAAASMKVAHFQVR